jgi:hypothetical protein
MNDLDLVRELRADVPSPTRARLAPGRAQLLASISRPSGPRHARRAILPVGAAAAAAAAIMIAGGVVSGPATRSTAPRAPATRLTLTAQLLNTAAAAVARQPTVRPEPHQWFYTKFVQYEYGQPIQAGENWETLDGRQTAYFEPDGQLIVHTSTAPVITGGGPTALDQYNANATSLTAYNALASLPSGPRALLGVVAQQVAAVGSQNVAAGSPVSWYTPASRGGLEFDYLAQLLWNAAGAAAPPAAEAAVFRAMAAIPQVSSQRGITDIAGQPAVGLSASGGKSQLLLDPQTYQVIGVRVFSEGQKVSPRAAGRKAAKLHTWPPKGTLFISMAWAQVTMVSGPGRR